mgnify:CR=1 FL=1
MLLKLSGAKICKIIDLFNWFSTFNEDFILNIAVKSKIFCLDAINIHTILSEVYQVS